MKQTAENDQKRKKKPRQRQSKISNRRSSAWEKQSDGLKRNGDVEGVKE